jgi:hypothetical protein
MSLVADDSLVSTINYVTISQCVLSNDAKSLDPYSASTTTQLCGEDPSIDRPLGIRGVNQPLRRAVHS